MGTSPIRLVDETGIERFRGTQSPGGGSSPVLIARTYLDNAAILGLPTSGGIQLVPTPGPGKMLWPSDAVFYCDTTAAAYSGLLAGNELGVAFDPATPGDFLSYFGDQAVQGDPAALLSYGGLAAGTASGQVEVLSGLAQAGFAYGSQGYVWEDRPLYLVAANADGDGAHDYTGGDAANFMVVAVRYSILDLTP